MATQLNFSELKQNVSMENLLRHYGLLEGTKQVKEDELVGLCPIHEETQGSFHVSTSKNAWNLLKEGPRKTQSSNARVLPRHRALPPRPSWPGFFCLGDSSSPWSPQD